MFSYGSCCSAMVDDTVIIIIAVACMFSTFIVPLPQLIQFYDVKDPYAISGYAVILQCISTIICFVYSILIQNVTFTVISFYNFIMAICMWRRMNYYKKYQRPHNPNGEGVPREYV